MTTLKQVDLVTGLPTRSNGRTTGTWLRGPFFGRAAAAMAVLIVVLVIIPVILTRSPNAFDTDSLLGPPSTDHPFGTDQLGRDILARVVYGARLSMAVAALSALCALLAGGLLAVIAAIGPRWLGGLIMRMTDVGLAFPGILLAIVLAAAVGARLTTTVAVLGIIYTFPMARVIRSTILAEYGEDYVTSARLLGTRANRLIGYHVGLNMALPIFVYTTVVMADVVVAEAALSFIGAGIPQPAPSWGNIIRDGQTVVYAGAWWVALFPGFAIMLSVLGLNQFSESIGRRLRLR